MSEKPRFALAKLGPNATAEEVLDLFRKLTGKEPTPEEIDELKAEMVMNRGNTFGELYGGPAGQMPQERPPIQVDADIANADWPKRTKDVKTPSMGAT